MNWRSLLQAAPAVQRVPWLGDSMVVLNCQVWQLTGPTPPEHGWYELALDSRRGARWPGRPAIDPEPEDLERLLLRQRGYLLGDRFIPDSADARTAVRARAGTMNLAFADSLGTAAPDDVGAVVRFVAPGLRRFTRISVGRASGAGPLLFVRQEMPLGPEDDVLALFEDLPVGLRDPTMVPEATARLRAILGVSPALEAAFFFALRERVEVELQRERVRLALEAEQAARLAADARALLLASTGSSEKRRELALVDFEAAARASLAIGGAEYLSHQPNRGVRGEQIVRFRLAQRRFECVTDARMHVVEAGLCLSDHRTGRRDDMLLTLESLPGTYLEAIRRGKLVVTRHA